MAKSDCGPRRGSYQAGAVIVAAGAGRRMGGRDKVLGLIGGVPLVARAVEVFERSPHVDTIVLVLGRRALEQGREMARERGWQKVRAICQGGKRRQDSVRRGLAELPSSAWVVIHDGVRPGVDLDMIRRGIEAAMQTGAAVAAVPVKDTIKTATPEGIVQETPNRASLWAIQTPQVFRRDIIDEAHRRVADDVPDDAAMVERLGYSVRLFPGSYANLKVTTWEDLRLTEAILGIGTEDGKGRMRVGIGFDAHTLVEGRKLMLGGVEIPFLRGLEGHSDGDVLAHAAIDAVLGGASLGDIGTHFPSSDTALKNISGLELLRRTAGILGEHGWHIANLDATIVAEWPKMGPYLSVMSKCVAEALGLDSRMVSVKVTTSDGLGFIGRGEGIAVYAVASVEETGR